MAQLLQRIESLEGLSKGDFDSQLARLSAYGLRSEADFDKYTALSMAEKCCPRAHRLSHDKASFLDAAIQGLQASTDKFQAYFLTLFSDKDYTKVLDSLAKVDKAHKRTAPASSQASTQPGSPSTRPNRIRCFSCGIPGHTAANCFRRPYRGRYSPYTKPLVVVRITE
ncbi:hypothetical protein OS493_019331 [Desmophyllum pertusum]|uniref:CCHC-type domain-containing protein n=1 Tax=Desmophyllum pertusum TaxID=174260 RepID=A0A9X0D8Z0_9CNID|nr:hypothetical protein OS493_019331 [Desmophyllum pertusum]